MKFASFNNTWTDSRTHDKLIAHEWIAHWQSAGTQCMHASPHLTLTSTVANSVTGAVTANYIVVGSGGPFPTTVTLPALALPDHPPNTPRARRPAPLEFSAYISASELVVEFLEEARLRIPGLTRERFLKLTIADFFAFLMRRAAEADGVPPPEMADSPLPLLRPRCGGCGRFLSRRFALLQIVYCGSRCLERVAARNGIALAAG